MPSFTIARSTNSSSSTLNESERMKKWSNKRANQITDKAYSFEDAEMFANHLESELFNVCYDLDIANNSNAYLEGTMRTMQKELAELREFKAETEKTLSRSPDLTGVFNYEQKEMKRAENATKKAAKKAAEAPKKNSSKCVQERFGGSRVRRACTKNSKFKGYYADM
jgi:dsDNA-specific endonuclease/ATPase MutS2